MFKYPIGYRFLQIAFIIVPIVAGLDKFFNFLVHWPDFICPQVSDMLQGYDQAFMMAVGVVEIIVGIGNLLVPKVFAFITAAWLIVVITNLILTGQDYDIALRDLGLCLSALGFGILSFRK